MFYVYLLLLATQTKFKIGKTNDVHGRIRDLDMHWDFDLAGSRCIRLQTEAESKRLEKILHRALAKWRLEFDPNNRRPGDTEMFATECFPRAVELLTHMADLHNGALPEPLPEQPPCIIVPKKTWYEAKKAQLNRRRQEQEEADQRFNRDMAVIECALDQLTAMKLDVFEQCQDPYPFIVVESSDRELFQRAVGILGELQMLAFSPEREPMRWSFMICELTHTWDEAAQRGTATALLVTPRRRGSYESWNVEFLALLDLIPRSKVARVPLESKSEFRKRA